MNAAEHYDAAQLAADRAEAADDMAREAKTAWQIEQRQDRRDYHMARAQWHATMAQAAATAELHPQGLTPGTFGRPLPTDDRPPL